MWRSRRWCGTTSACAENTNHRSAIGGELGNYLRVRGEYYFLLYTLHYGVELPPRARRIRKGVTKRLFVVGTTSACAENTQWLWPIGHANRNYLRVRGEYDLTFP